MYHCYVDLAMANIFGVINTVFNRERKCIPYSLLCDVCGVIIFTEVGLYLQ
jgi:hypothetical protein